MARRPAAALFAGAALSVATAVVTVAASFTLSSSAITPYQTCALAATPATTTSVIDAPVRQATATSNFGTATTLSTSSASAANQRIYVRFDLTLCSPTIASTAVVRLATLRLYLSAIPAACRTLDLFRVTASWTEAANSSCGGPACMATSGGAAASAGSSGISHDSSATHLFRAMYGAGMIPGRSTSSPKDSGVHLKAIECGGSRPTTANIFLPTEKRRSAAARS